MHYFRIWESDVLIPRQHGQFKRDVRKMERRGKNMRKLRMLLALLIEEKPLPAAYKDHSLRGEWVSYRDAHIEPDWLLIYRVTDGEFLLARTGTHSDLFDE